MTVPTNSFLGTTAISTLAAPVNYEYEQTSPAVAQAYYENIKTIYDIYNSSPATLPASSDPTFTTQANANAAAQALANLLSLAQNGLISNNTPTTQKRYFMTVEMASNLDLLVRSFQAVGAINPATGITQEQLAKWKDLASVSSSIFNIMSNAIGAIQTNSSLQAMVELDYVKTGSDLIGEQLSSLDSALTITNNVLTTLANLQDIMNRMVVKQPGPFDKTLGGAFPGTPANSNTASTYLNPFQQAASAFFNKNIIPLVASNIVLQLANFSTNPMNVTLGAQGLEIFDKLVAIQRSIQLFIPQLSATLSAATRADPNSLYGRLKSVLADFSAAFVYKTSLLSTAPSFAGVNATTAAQKAQAINRFLLDNSTAVNSFYYVRTRSPGDMQSNVTFATTAAQGLNSQQNDNVRNFLFVFEEFYKSASSILSSLTQIIQKMAQHISG